MAKKNKPQEKLTIVADGGYLSIKDVVVADPSIEFTVAINPEVVEPSEDGVYLKNLEIQLSISNLDPDHADRIISIGRIFIASMAQPSAYFYFTFGDVNYVAGTKFTLYLVLSAYNPTTGIPIKFSNPTMIEVYGGGEPRIK